MLGAPPIAVEERLDQRLGGVGVGLRGVELEGALGELAGGAEGRPRRQIGVPSEHVVAIGEAGVGGRPVGLQLGDPLELFERVPKLSLEASRPGLAGLQIKIIDLPVDPTARPAR